MVVDSYQEKNTRKRKIFIPSCERILFLLKKSNNEISKKNLEKKLNLQSCREKRILHKKLKTMDQNSQIIYNCNKCYVVQGNHNIVTGRVIGHRDGYGFLRTEILKEDLWLSIEQMKLCMHGDVILAYSIKSKKKNKNIAKVLKVLKSNNILIVGQYHLDKKIGFVIPYDNRLNFKIFVSSSIATQNIIVGSIVVVKLNKRSMKHNIKGKIIEVLGQEMETNLSINIALRTHSIPHIWSNEVHNQLCNINNVICQKDLDNRVDLRHVPFFTIDEEDARDFDDAVFCRKKDNQEGWTLWVAISDVSYYIKPNTALDKAAFQRGNSIYFPSFVVPMLPEKISIDLCSLNPFVERLCLICEMNLSNLGELTTYKHYEAVIRSHGRFTYDEIFDIWKGNAVLKLKHKDFLKNIQDMSSLYKVLNHNISTRGICFENIEAKFILDKNLKIEKIYKKVRNDAHKFIESCMILANIASAQFVEQYKFPVLFRSHDRPNKDSIVNLRLILKKLGLSLLGGMFPKASHYSDLLKKIFTCSNYEIIQTFLLRSMKQAVYSEDNRGHFGLSIASYVHFTSPIRRYPDLILHRVIKSLLSSQKNMSLKKKNINVLYNRNEMKKIGLHCSMTERRADDASRDVIDWLKCEFMQKKIGHILKGVISNVTSFGFFVRLNQFFIDGLVHIANLKDDYYYFDSVGLKLIGKSTKNVYRLGDALHVKVMSINLHERKIELSL